MKSRFRQRSRCRSICLVVLIAVAAAAPFTSAAFAQQSDQMTLPQVTVTAPPFVPLYMRPGNGVKAFERNPYFGNNRVEENRFAPVPCSGFRIDPASAGASDRTCLQGYRLEPASVAVSNGRGDTSMTHCDIDHDVTIYNVGDLSIEADVLVFDPHKLDATGYPDRDCYVPGYTGYDEEDFQDMNRITRSGLDWQDLRGETCKWSDLRAACETKSIEFSYGPHKCIAVRRPGPRWEAGYVWMLTASICHTDGESVQPGDVDRALGAVQIRQYDPVGNVARPPQ
jgi:hypothetical protein